MKKTKYIFILLSLIFILSFAACSNYDNSSEYLEGQGQSAQDGNNIAVAPDTLEQDTTTSSTDSKTTILENVVNNETNRKIIYSYSLTMRTKEYDNNISSIKSLISEYGGYIENASESGSKPDNLSDEGRNAYMTVRIPVAKAQEFVDNTSKLAEVTGSKTTGSDVTQSYMDIEIRIENIQIRIDRLQELLKKATSTTDIITIEKELNDATVELEGYTSTKKGYDNLIEYATIDLSLQEVNTSSSISSDGSNLTFWQSVSVGFSSVISGLWFFIKNVLIFLLSVSPILIILAGIAAAIIIPRKKRQKQKMEKLRETLNQNENKENK